MVNGLVVDLTAWRSEDVTADAFAELCESVGLSCVSQELMSWERGLWLSDTISVFTRRGSCWDRERTVQRNPLFGSEARRMAALYPAPGSLVVAVMTEEVAGQGSEIHLAIVTDAAYLPWCATTIASTLLASAGCRIVTHVLHADDVILADQDRLRVMTVDLGGDLDFTPVDEQALSSFPTKGVIPRGSDQLGACRTGRGRR